MSIIQQFHDINWILFALIILFTTFLSQMTMKKELKKMHLNLIESEMRIREDIFRRNLD